MEQINLENNSKITTGFKVPDNYFENFSVRLMLNIPEKEIKRISIFKKTKTWVYAAAAILVLGICLSTLTKYNSNSNAQKTAELENYIANNTTIDDNDIADLLSENDIKKLNIDFKIENNTIENELINNENLEQYLLD